MKASIVVAFMALLLSTNPAGPWPVHGAAAESFVLDNVGGFLLDGSSGKLLAQ